MATPRYPPGPMRKFPGDHIVSLSRNPLGFLQKVAAKYGEIAHFKIGSTHLYLLSNPDYIKDVLVVHHQNFLKGHGLQRAKRLLGEGLLTSEGEFHRRQRRLAQPAFQSQRVYSYAKVMTAHAAQMQARWKDGQTTDIADEMKRLTLLIAGETLFGANVESDVEEVNRALTASMNLFNVVRLPFMELLEKLPLPGVRRFEKAKQSLDATIYRIIRDRRASGEDKGDLLSMLLMAQDTEGDGSGMSDQQLRDEAMTIFLAGHETTANALTWTWYLLSQNPEAEAKLHAELDTVLSGRTPTPADVPKLPYTEMVFTESMRLYPPAWTLGRRAVKDHKLGEYTIPANSVILMSQYVMHRDARFFPEPLKFIPERWLPEARATRPKFSYFPFGAGPRVCIGELFAMMEGLLLVAAVAQHWRMSLAQGQRVEPQALVTLRAKYGMSMVLKKRSNF